MLRWRRTAVAFALVPSLVCVPLLPAVHLHKGDGDHVHAIVHRHVDGHATRGTAMSDHDDDSPIWLGDPVFQPATVAVVSVLAEVPSNFEAVVTDRSCAMASLDEAAPPHGPPRWRLPARAPPSSHL